MVQQLPPSGAALSVDRVETGLGDADFAIPADDIRSFSATAEAGKSMDEGEIAIDNAGYQYTKGDQQVGIGDRVKFWVSTGEGFGEGPFGEGPFGDARLIGTFRVTDRDIVDHPGVPCDLTLDLADWVFSTLAIRPVWHPRGPPTRPICGSPDSHVNQLVKEARVSEAEIDTGALPTVSETTDYFVRGKDAREAIDELAEITASKTGPIIQRSYGNRLIFEPISNIEPVRETPFPDRTFGPLSTSESDKGLTNWIRMSGGIDDSNLIDDSQTTVDHYTAPTNSSRLTAQVSVRKSELTTIDLWTESETSDAGIRVRLQSGNVDDTAPIAPGDTDSDIVTGPVLEEDMTAGGWTQWQMPSHTLNSPNPWLIVDSPGSNTTGVGVDANENVAFQAYFPKPVESVVGDRLSQRRYGRYGSYRTRESMVTEPAISDRARGILEDQGWPDTELGPVTALSDDAHSLVVGDIVPFDRPEVGADGEFIVTSKSDTYSGPTLRTEIEFKRVDNYA